MAETSMGNQEAGAMGFWHRYRLLIVVVAISVAIIGWLYVSKGMAVRHVEEAAAAQRAELVKQAEARQTETVRQSLTMFGVPLAWAIRREMMADNLDQVDQSVTDLVKQKGFERVVVAKADGSVMVASDRKHKGAAFSRLYAERYLGAEQISAEETGPGKWLVVVPIMGLNARLGTVAMDYQAPASTLGQ
ncbi:hypothetical protein [Sulfuricella sp.]|uniref:hypothetical protein n=1 Tax=Sulfuricella sp. TaxID=2099377 RepID=UPI002C8EB502|nr:hypothetical protein [Sulfuricella sp.]HUX63319.1 hypothetical protein [Sulfuricella sp.]